MAKFILSNISKTNLGFTIYTPSPEGSELMAQHKRRKFKNSGNFYINLRPNSSIDLVEATGMSVKDLLDSPEVRELINVKSHKVRYKIEDESEEVTETLEEKSEEAPVEEPKDEPKEEPKPKKAKKSKKKTKADEKESVAPPPVDVMPPAMDKKDSK